MSIYPYQQLVKDAEGIALVLALATLGTFPTPAHCCICINHSIQNVNIHVQGGYRYGFVGYVT